MHMTRRAPELSATSRLVCIWIMSYLVHFLFDARRAYDACFFSPRTTAQRLSLEIGRCSSIHTMSPTLNSFFSSCAWYFFERRTVFLNSGWVKRRSTLHHHRLVLLVAHHDALQDALRHASYRLLTSALAVWRALLPRDRS